MDVLVGPAVCTIVFPERMALAFAAFAVGFAAPWTASILFLQNMHTLCLAFLITEYVMVYVYDMYRF